MAERARIGVLISGRGSNMAALLYASRADDCPFEIVLVASNNPDAAGLAHARAEGVPVFAQSHRDMDRAAFDRVIDDALRGADVTHVALAGYMRMLSPEFVAGWAGRMINIHPSLLPAYKGLHTHRRALEANDAVAGCTVHLVTEELDGGPALGQARVAIIPGDTPETLAARVLLAEHQLYPRMLAAFVTRESGRDWLLEKVREQALGLPQAEEVLSHGMPAFRIAGGRMYAYFTHDHHGDDKTALIVKTSGVEEQAMLIEADPDLYYRPAYFGPAGWVGIRLDARAPDWSHVGDAITRSWRLVAPKKLAALPI